MNSTSPRIFPYLSILFCSLALAVPSSFAQVGDIEDILDDLRGLNGIDDQHVELMQLDPTPEFLAIVFEFDPWHLVTDDERP